MVQANYIELLFLPVKLTDKLANETIFTKEGADERPFEFKIDEGEATEKALKILCNLNDATCKLKVKDYKQVDKLCTKVRSVILSPQLC
ncbi:hypothetical protein E5676_scaffold178G00160 [Cucumis melo var. makuwa]|uniref:Uncharacterized protein n=1 Tax=Cucumis melo var. makuwa TaxID=1194695 RepID=A0A5D3C557_CUCMM|nr:hypothetical protein E6C27_scaffold1290G00530 [Cucumis melo var. makuwa]TYK05516.1 hypothetical protein E5676_scaffold178G00160 [Cucumis melo var. makuwa]